jgi:hypothetical protein
MDKMKLSVLAVAVGVVVTLVTGLIENMPAMLVGAVHYGYPMAWLIRMIVGPEYNPWVVNPLGLIVDIVVWTLVAWIVLFVATRPKKLSK